MPNIRPFDLPPATEVPSSAAFILDTGAVVQKASAEQIVDSAIPLATQAEAETGSGNDTRMSPLRVQQAINAQALSQDFLAGPDGAGAVGLEQGGTVQEAVDASRGNISDNSQQRAMFKREIYTEAPFYNAALLSAISTYSYSYLYPQGFFIDQTAQELITMHCRVGGVGDNAWAWFVVWDISDPDVRPLPAKTTFSYPASAARESVFVRRIAGVRYLEFHDVGTLVRVDIDTLPADGSAVSAAATFAIDCFPWITYDPVSNQYLAGDGRSGPGAVTTTKDRFLWRDGDDPTIITGSVRLPIVAVGSNFPNYIDKLPKSQGIAVFNGSIFVGTGGTWPMATDSISRSVGLSQVAQDGSLVASALATQASAQTLFSAMAGRTIDNQVENEGVCAADGSLYALWQTLSSAEIATAISQERGVIVTREMAADGTDFSANSQAAPTPFSREDFQSRVHISADQLTNPVTGDTLDTLGEILDMMASLGLERYSFYGFGQTITDINAASLPVAGAFVTVDIAGGAAAKIEILGNSGWRRLWVSPTTAGLRVQYNNPAEILSDGAMRFSSTASFNPAFDNQPGFIAYPTSGFSGNKNTAGGATGALGRAADGSILNCYHAGSQVGSVSVTASATSYNTSSDATLKNDKGELSYDDALAIMRLVTIHEFDWKATGEADVGVFAQELHGVYPRAVTVGGWFIEGEDGEEPAEEGDEGAFYRPWAVDYSKLIPVMFRVIQGLAA